MCQNLWNLGYKIGNKKCGVPVTGYSDPIRTLRMVGVAGFEPAASWTRTMRDTKLRHTPKDLIIIMRFSPIVKPRRCNFVPICILHSTQPYNDPR